jgi:hypothetical protein
MASETVPLPRFFRATHLDLRIFRDFSHALAFARMGLQVAGDFCNMLIIKGFWSQKGWSERRFGTKRSEVQILSPRHSKDSPAVQAGESFVLRSRRLVEIELQFAFAPSFEGPTSLLALEK